MMAETINVGLAISQFEGLCRSAGIELSDLLYVAEGLTKADDLQNLHPEPKYPKGLEMHADYVGEKPLWKDQEKMVAEYFWDLANRTGLELKTRRGCGITGCGPTPNSLGYHNFFSQIATPSGKPMEFVLTQYYTYEQERAHIAEKRR